MKLSTIATSIDRVIRTLTAASILLLVATVFWTIIARNLLGLSQPWLNELARYIQAWVVFLAAYVLTKEGDHITMEAFYIRFPPRVRLLVLKAIGVLTLLAATLGLVYSSRTSIRMIVRGETSGSGALPAVLGSGAVTTGFFLMIVASVYYLLYRSNQDDADIVDAIG